MFFNWSSSSNCYTRSFPYGNWFMASSAGILQDQDVFATGNGQVTNLGAKAVNNRIGRTLGGPDADGSVLVKFYFTQG